MCWIAALRSNDGHFELISVSLKTFREAHDPDHFYSEKELAAMYVEAYPQSIDRRARRYARLVERQLAALVWIEELLATDPQPQDPVAAWFEDRLAARLILAGLPTIEALHQRVRTQGYRPSLLTIAAIRRHTHYTSATCTTPVIQLRRRRRPQWPMSRHPLQSSELPLHY